MTNFFYWKTVYGSVWWYERRPTETEWAACAWFYFNFCILSQLLRVCIAFFVRFTFLLLRSSSVLLSPTRYKHFSQPHIVSMVVCQFAMDDTWLYFNCSSCIKTHYFCGDSWCNQDIYCCCLFSVHSLYFVASQCCENFSWLIVLPSIEARILI